MIHAQAAGVAKRGADRLDERLIACGPQPMRVERRQAPILARMVKGVRRRTDGDARRQHVLPLPGIRAAGIDPDREIVNQRRDGRPPPPVGDPAATAATCETPRDPPAPRPASAPPGCPAAGTQAGQSRQSPPHRSASVQKTAKACRPSPCDWQ